MKRIILLSIVLSFGILQANDFLTISLVRNDGILIPFMRFENNKWKSILNRSNEFIYYERRVQNWYISSGNSKSIILDKGTEVQYDHQSYGYLTDYRELTNVDPIWFGHITAVATNIDFPIISILSLNNNNELKEKISEHIIQELENDDFKTTETLKSSKGFKGKLIDIQSINYFSVDSLTYYYVEAGKDLELGQGCDYFFKSFYWIVLNKGKYQTLYNEYTFDDCDYKMVSGIGRKPFGAFKHKNKIYCIIVNTGWDGYEYIFVEFTLEKYKEIFYQ